ncbi:hypothetical protein VWW31_001676 [Cronobacter sakazakii]|nr:hypothetical protein [Cronobacter sakazakii]EME2064276.1 hypothetical protein [Cronobacter sakazakii]EME2108120.1 hypothetical protein [Cronobacter sakazakii]
MRVGSEAVAQHCLKDDAAFIAEASPKAVLCLIAALEAEQKLNAELDDRLLRYAGIATRRAEHVAELEKRVAELGARTVKLPAFDGYKEDIVRELQGAFRIACGDAGINL